MTLNLHGLVRGAVQVVNDDSDGTVYVSTGHTNTRGILTPTYTAVTARLQVQAQKHTDITHERSLQFNNGFLTMYAYGKFSDIERRSNQGGDVVNIPAGPRAGWYLITQVLEWWPGWCAFEVTAQLDYATIQDYIAKTANGTPPAP